MSAFEASDHGSVIDFPTFGRLAAIEVLTIRGDPMLKTNGVAGGDFSLRRGSPCIDRGNPNAPLGPDGPRRNRAMARGALGTAVGFDVTYAPAPQV